MNVGFSPSFRRQIKKAAKATKTTFINRLNLFMEDPFNQLLNNHELVGKASGYRSIEVTEAASAIYRLVDEKTAYFTEIGSHKTLYR